MKNTLNLHESLSLNNINIDELFYENGRVKEKSSLAAAAASDHFKTVIHCPTISNKSNSSSYVISLEGSRRLWRGFSKFYNLDYGYYLHEGINPTLETFEEDDFRKYNWVPPEDPSTQVWSHTGCTLSHFTLWETIYNSKNFQTDKYFLIFEDDAILFPWSEKCLNHILNEADNDFDIIMFNGRSSLKIASCLCVIGENKNLEITGNKYVYSAEESAKLFRDNSSKMPPANEKQMRRPHLLGGTDGYILSRTGLKKLVHYSRKFGALNTSLTIGESIDQILFYLTKDNTMINRKNASIYRKIHATGLLESPYLKGYISTYPVSDLAERLSIFPKFFDTLGPINKHNLDNTKEITQIKGIKSTASINSQPLSQALELEISDAKESQKYYKNYIKSHGFKKFKKDSKQFLKGKNNLWRNKHFHAQINEINKIVFIHIPKCGGTSIDNSELFEPIQGIGHKKYDFMKEMLGERFEQFKIFTLCRNPWDRLASAFYYLSNGGNQNKLDLSFMEKIKEFEGNLSSFLNDFSKSPENYLKILHFQPMHKFFNPTKCNNEFFVLKLENIQTADLDSLYEFIGKEFKIRHERKGPKALTSKSYNEFSFQSIAEIYEQDIELFGYTDYNLSDINY